MEDYVQAFLTGSAIGGVSIMMFEANKFVLKRLWGVNCIAAKLAWDIINKVTLEQILERRLVKAKDQTQTRKTRTKPLSIPHHV